MTPMVARYVKEHGKLDREYVQANLGRLAPLTQPKLQWWYEFNSRPGMHKRVEGAEGYQSGGGYHYGPKSTCRHCWKARLLSLYPEHTFSNEALGQ